ncbi:hypothetical protein B0H63DRAFT_416347 [Podospora didyma]|uniref:Uncharacterized protein n=1 Tax=Podospora didyma TaxID=330526 RepID=A0AAE0TVY6_9PEZI|nr:hypothetical protein B0H63DRAFT_416347 [Podospora didyma]
MAVEGATQALVAAFTFGIVVNAASAALFLCIKGHGTSIFRDSPRLVLILFLLSSALWAQVDFITVLLDISKSSMPCQVGVIFSTIFDQLGRFSIEQYLIWAMNDGTKISPMQMIPQLLILGRFIAGAVFVGFTRPQTDTFCLATSSALPISILVIALDAVILLLLVVRAFSTGLVANIQKGGSGSARSKSFMLVMLGHAIWTATSVTLLLGIRTVDLIARTAVPAGGLVTLIIIITACVGSLSTPKGSSSRPPEAPSPRRLNISRDISTSDSDYPPSRYEDIKEAAIRSSTTFVNPRNVPIVKDEAGIGGLPIVARPITGVAGMGGVPIQGELFPPPRTETVVESGRASRKLETSGSQKWKKNLFDFGKGGPAAALSAGKITISHPILQDDDPQNPLKKIATIGLEEAARAEKERRTKAQVDSAAVINRPAPLPPSTNSEESLKRAVSFKRKEVASVSLQPSTFPMALQPDNGALSTSAQLSPGGDEVRRRSPRQSTQDQSLLIPAPQPSQVPQAVQVRPESPLRQEPARTLIALPQQALPRPDIRPSRALIPSPEAPPEPPKNPLQRRPTIGLPSNPRARGLKVAQEAGAQQQQTIMFVNNITYDDPTGVQTIIKGANDMAANDRALKAASAALPDSPGTARSVVNRPRPIPRKAPESPAQASPAVNHRRSKSGGSLVRKSILTSTPGSPTQLPPLPLPPPPRSAGVGLRPQPNDTKSMTFDEKMAMFFPAPPNGNTVKRRSSVPELPPIPATYLDMNSSPTESERRRSNRTTKTSIRTGSILDVDEIPKNPAGPPQLSPLAYTGVADEVGNSWLPGISMDDGNNKALGKQNSTGSEGKRASSPLIPPVRSSAWTESTETRTRYTRDDSTTNWGSVYSPELAVSVPVPQMAYPTAVQKGDRRVPAGSKANAPLTQNRDSDVLPIMFDVAPIVEAEPMVKPERVSQPSWHRRVGDDCPTFSEKARSRKMPPPSPLTLNTFTKKNTVIIHTEPSPFESPEQALQKIQAQLKELEKADRNSLESPTRRLALLENLEKEMGVQQDHWQEMKHDIGRDSLSSIQTTSPVNRNSRVEPVAVNLAQELSSVRASIGAERRASRRARVRNSGSAKPKETSVHSPEGSRTNNWQKRLTEAQAEYMDAAAELLRTRGVNFLSMSNAQLGSPTPPDSHSDTDEEVPRLPSRLGPVATQQSRKQPRRALLWEPAQKESSSSTSLLWAPTPKMSSEAELPPLGLPESIRRSAPRKEELAPLPIHSSQLWRKPHRNVASATTGLWRPPWASAAPPAETVRLSSQGMSQSQSQKAPRPLTQRPPRRNKRVTLLPDILESPQPLPDKRGTLGIFQFPWGEKSDTASMQPRPSRFMAMPGTMTSGGTSINAAAKQLESAEYSSSFFDDYDDDENDERNSDEGDGDDSDDGFDETTLWEIASLLKSDSVPSKNSMFPPPTSSSVVDDYLDDFPSDDERRSSREQSIMIGLAEEPQEVLFEQPRDSMMPDGLRRKERISVESTTLPSLENDEDDETGESIPLLAAAKTHPKPSMIPRPAAPAVVEVAPEPAQASAPVLKSSMIPRLAAGEIKKTRKARKQVSAGLWDLPAQPKESSSSSEGTLFEVDPSRSDYRTTSEEPAAKNLNRKQRPSEPKPLEDLSSKTLWAAKGDAASVGLWMGMSSPKQDGRLWMNRTLQPKKSQGGMFKVDPTRTDYRTTSSEPAAKVMGRKHRPAELKPLEKLSSTALWAAKRDAVSPGLWMENSSLNQDGKLWINGKPTSKKAQTQGGMFKVDPTRADYRTTSSEPAAKVMGRKPRPAELKALETVSSSTLWADADAPKEGGRHWISSVSRSSTEHKKPASRADWAAALKDAVSASYPITKPAPATPAEWDAALQEAISLSTRQLAAPFDSATRHPVFAAKSLVTRSEWFHPAATGYTYDVANVHPVFFGSLAITCPEEAVHPAMSAYAAKKLRRQRSRRSTHDRSESRSRSLSRTDSSRSRRSKKDEIIAQIRALEQEDSDVLPPVPRVPTEITAELMSRNAMIQAQVEALEQEREWVQRAAQEDYNRRASRGMFAQPLVSEPEPMPEASWQHRASMGVQTIQDLQRHLESQDHIRQSLMWTDPPSSSLSANTTIKSSPSSPSREPMAEGAKKQAAQMWSAPAKASPTNASTGLWPATGQGLAAVAAPSEDADASARRARGRKSKQKKERRAEILAQIAAIESGSNPNPFAHYQHQAMWSLGASVRSKGGGRKNWLADSKANRVSRVALRY